MRTREDQIRREFEEEIDKEWKPKAAALKSEVESLKALVLKHTNSDIVLDATFSYMLRTVFDGGAKSAVIKREEGRVVDIMGMR